MRFLGVSRQELIDFMGRSEFVRPRPVRRGFLSTVLETWTTRTFPHISGSGICLLSCLSPRIQELFHLLLMLVAGYNNIGTGYSAAAFLTGVAWPVHKYKGQSDFQSPLSHFQSLSSHFQSFSSHFQSFSSHFQSFRVNHSNYKPCDTSKFINNSSPSRSSFP